MGTYAINYHFVELLQTERIHVQFNCGGFGLQFGGRHHNH